MSGRHRAAGLATRVRALDGERGALSLWAIGTVLSAFVILSFVVDSAAKITAAEHAQQYAAEAARAAAIGVGPRPAGTSIDTRAAVAATQAYLASAGLRGSVTVTGPATVEVSVSVTEHGPLDNISFTATGTATAQLLVGISTGQEPG